MLDTETSIFLFVSTISSTIIWLAAVLYVIRVKKCPIYHPLFIFLAYHFLGFIVRPLLILDSGFSPAWLRIGYEPSETGIVLVTLTLNLALISTLVGFNYFDRNKIIPKLEIPEFIISNRLYFYTLLLILSSISLYAISKSIGDTENVFSYELDIDDKGGRRLSGVSGYFTSLSLFMPGILIFLFSIRQTRTLSLILTSCFVLVRFYAGSNRTSFVVVLLAIFLIYQVIQNRRYASLWLMLPIVFSAFVFEVIGADRTAIRKVLDGALTPTQMYLNYKEKRGGNSLTSDAMEFDVSTAAIDFITQYDGYTYGTQYLRLLIWPIPRQIWPDKPVYTSTLDLNQYGFFRDLTITNYADTYSAGSFPAVVFGFFILGAVFSRIYRLAANTKKPITFSFYWIFVVYLFLILRDGGVTFVIFWAFALVPIILLTWIGRVKACSSPLQ